MRIVLPLPENFYICTDNHLTPKAMKVINLGEKASVLNNFIAEMRDVHIQKDSLRFRINMERVGEVFAYELSKTLSYSVKDVTTPLGVASIETSDSHVVIATVLRAGLPLQNGMLKVFDHAETAFLTTYRKSGKGDYFQVRADYCNCPELEGKVLILVDPMAATGSTIKICLEKLQAEGGDPIHIHLVCPIVSRYALDQLCQSFGDEVSLWVAAVDEELTSHNLVIPGLGDAGDLAFGGKR